MKPTCKICKGTGRGVEFPMLPKTAGFRFGDICAICDEGEGE